LHRLGSRSESPAPRQLPLRYQAQPAFPVKRVHFSAF
jgi:hypothetical protein